MDRRSDPSVLKAEIERRRKRALDSGIPGTLLQLFEAGLRFYGSWSEKASHRSGIFPEVQASGSPESQQGLELRYRDKCFVIRYQRRPSWHADEDQRYELTVTCGDASICELTVTESIKEWGTERRLSHVGGFVEGPDMTVFGEFLARATQWSDRKSDEARKALDSRLLEDEAKKFGL